MNSSLIAVKTLPFADRLQSMYRQQFSTAVLTLSGWNIKTWQLAGVPMKTRLPDGDLEFSGRFLASTGPEGALLGVLLRRLPPEMPVVILCLESHLDLFEAWFEAQASTYGNREITIVAEKDPGLDTGGGIKLALNEVKTPFVVTMDGSSYLNRAQIYQDYLLTQQEYLMLMRDATVGMIMGVPQSEDRFDSGSNYFKLDEDSDVTRQTRLVVGWSERGQVDVPSDWLINPGFYAFKTEVLKKELAAAERRYGPKFSMEDQVMPELVRLEKIRGFVAEWLVWRYIGTPREFWKRFTSAGKNRLGDSALVKNCEEVVVHSCLRNVGLLVKGLREAVVTMVHTPRGPFLLIHPLVWTDRPLQVAECFDALIKTGYDQRIFAVDLDGGIDEALLANLKKQVTLPEADGVAVWSAFDVSIRTYPDLTGRKLVYEIIAK